MAFDKHCTSDLWPLIVKRDRKHCSDLWPLIVKRDRMREDDDFVCSYLRFRGSAQINIVATYGLYSQARSYIIKLRNCLNSFSTKSQVLSCTRGWRLCMFISSVQCTIVLVIIDHY
jgi:hypothetical protein